MSIEALIFGKLHQPAERRTSKTGHAFVTAKVRAAVGEAESVFVNVIAFADSACTALLALDAGDAVALAGTLKPGAWIDREGKARPSVDIVVSQVLSAYTVKKRREAAAGVQPSAARKPAPVDDFGEKDDAWLRGGAHE